VTGDGGLWTELIKVGDGDNEFSWPK
jgi:hypothetical protein